MKRLTLISLTFAAGLVLALGLVACGGNDATAVGEVPAGTSPDPTGTQPSGSNDEPGGEPGGTGEEDPSGEPEPAADISYRVWFVHGEGEALYPATRTHEATRAVGAASLTDLFAGPTEAERSDGVFTAVPEGTRLLGLVVSDGLATVDLSSEFESGGGSLSMMARLGQVACTLDQFPTVNGVSFKLDGEPVDVFSGEGIVLDKPVTCADYEDLLPVIVVESPAPGSEIQSGTKVTGSANVFEANVLYELVGGDHVFDEGFTTATCGTGCRGTFSFRLRFQVDEPLDATLVVFDSDAAGIGQPPHEVRIPVTLMPS
jgi:spore germination protein GerM